MTYSLDLRERVVEFVEAGGGITQAAKVFKVGRATIYTWLSRADLRPTKVKRRQRKLDWNALRQAVKAKPDAKLSDYAAQFGVTPSAIHYALTQMKITRKKRIKVS